MAGSTRECRRDGRAGGYVQGDDDPCPQEMRDAGWVVASGGPEIALGALMGRVTP